MSREEILERKLRTTLLSEKWLSETIEDFLARIPFEGEERERDWSSVDLARFIFQRALPSLGILSRAK